jgi:four helix bundle protein
MAEEGPPRRYDLEERTELFAKACRRLAKRVPQTVTNIEDIRQSARASGSVAANYIEANEALSKKDFLMRIKISRKESKESRLFLRLLDTGADPSVDHERAVLCQEATELMLILSAILRNSGGA